ncbi:MAG: B12-binding domain-containing radical SAM protein [Acidobacteriota bacterium]
MNILLVRPKSEFFDMVLGIPIGPALLAAVAEREGHTCRILDLAVCASQEKSWPVLEQALDEQSWDLVGITCMTVEYSGAKLAADFTKQRHPDLPIVFGGQHATIQSREVLAEPHADYVVIGEGEDTFRELLEVVAGTRRREQVDGLCWKNEGQPVFNMPRAAISDLDSIPLPAYHLLDIPTYFEIGTGRYAPRSKYCLQIFTSRGCPWKCIYCHDLFGKKFRARSPENVFSEIELLYNQYGVRELMIEDDIFNLDLARAKTICDLIIASPLKLHMQFENGLRLECFDEELVQKLAQAGTHHISIAIESASPRVQKLIKKNLKLHKLSEVLGWMKKYGISTLGFFMMGFPFETVEDIEETIRFARRSDLDEALFSIAVPYAGTDLNKLVYEEGSYDPNQASMGGKGITLIKTEHFDFARLKKLQRKAYFTFFMSRYRFVKAVPRLMHYSTAKTYLKAIERNFLGYGGGATSRVN